MYFFSLGVKGLTMVNSSNSRPTTINKYERDIKKQGWGSAKPHDLSTKSKTYTLSVEGSSDLR